MLVGVRTVQVPHYSAFRSPCALVAKKRILAWFCTGVSDVIVDFSGYFRLVIPDCIHSLPDETERLTTPGYPSAGDGESERIDHRFERRERDRGSSGTYLECIISSFRVDSLEGEVEGCRRCRSGVRKFRSGCTPCQLSSEPFGREPRFIADSAVLGIIDD